jgi:hypothetical protein
MMLNIYHMLVLVFQEGQGFKNLNVTQHHEMSRFVHLRKRENYFFFSTGIHVLVYDVFCPNRPIVVPRYDKCTPNML